MRNATIPFVIILFSLVSACNMPPVSIFPLSQPGEYKHDEQLLGDWYTEEKGGIIFLHIWKKNEELIDIVFVNNVSTGDKGIIYCKAFPASIEERTFLNISQCKTKLFGGRDPIKLLPHDYYWHVFYEISDEGKLIFKFMSSDYIKESIRSGELVGIVVKDVYRNEEYPEVIITDGLATLIKFIEYSYMDDLFLCGEFGCKYPFQKFTNPSLPKPE